MTFSEETSLHNHLKLPENKSVVLSKHCFSFLKVRIFFYDVNLEMGTWSSFHVVMMMFGMRAADQD